MRNNLIAFGTLALILVVEGWVFGPTIIEVLLYQPEKCSGYTVYYDSQFGGHRRDCMGNRHPDDRVDVQVPLGPQTDIARDTPAVPRVPNPGDRGW